MPITTMKQGIALFLTGLLLIGFIPNATPQAALAFSMSFNDNQLNLDVSPGSNGTACTELVISNEGNVDIDVEGNTTGDDLVITPSNFSVSIETGESVSVPMCITAAIGSLHRTIQVVTAASAKDQYGNNAENKEEDIAVIVEQYASLSGRPELPIYEKACSSKVFTTTFIVINNGNNQDTIAIEVLNAEDLEDAGFTIALQTVQYQIDAAGEQPVEVTISTPAFDAAGDNNHTIIFQAKTTFQGETISHNTTVLVDILEIGDDEIDCGTEAEEDEEVVPSVSLISSIAAVAGIALRRRY